MSDRKKTDSNRKSESKLSATFDELQLIRNFTEEFHNMLTVQNCNQYANHRQSEVTYICCAPVCKKRFICDK